MAHANAQTEARAIAEAARKLVRNTIDAIAVEELVLDRTATALTSMSAELAAKEEARAEQWRLRRDAEGSRDVARAACDTMRHERDDARAALAEARKALEPFAALADIFDHPGGNRPREGMIAQWSDHRVGDRDITVEHLRAARRAHQGGEDA